MAVFHIPFPDNAWTQSETHPLEKKKVGPQNVALLRFEPGFVDENPCVRGHVIFVLSGTLELTLDDSVCAIETGQAVIVEAGTTHVAKNPSAQPVELFIVSDN